MGALSQGAAGGLPGLTLKAWAQVKTDGTLVKGSGVASVTKGVTGAYTVTLSSALAQAFATCRVSCVQTNNGGISGTASAGALTTTLIQLVTLSGATLTDMSFFLEVYE